LINCRATSKGFWLRGKTPPDLGWNDYRWWREEQEMDLSTRALAVGLTDLVSGGNQAMQRKGHEVVCAFYLEERIGESPADRANESRVSMGNEVKRGRHRLRPVGRMQFRSRQRSQAVSRLEQIRQLGNRRPPVGLPLQNFQLTQLQNPSRKRGALPADLANYSTFPDITCRPGIHGQRNLSLIPLDTAFLKPNVFNRTEK
jgi:hypothetical protein